MSTKAQSLQEVCDVALAGFDRTLYGYKGNVQYATFQPPQEILKQLPEFKMDDAKERWIPLRTDTKLDRVAVKKRHHIVREPDWEPPVKKPKFFFPPSKGMKLRSVAELNQEQQETKNMSSEEYEAYRRRKNIEKERSLTHSVVNKPAPPPAPVDTVQAILNEITAASRPQPLSAQSSRSADNSNHKATNNNVNPLSSSSTAPTTSSTVRKDRRLLNALRTKKDERLFKKPAPSLPVQRKGSSSSTSSGSTSATRHTVGKRPFPVAAIHKRPCPNLLSLKLHLTDDIHDEIALRKITDLMKRKTRNHVVIDVKERPKLMIHLRKPRRVEKITMLGKYKVRARSTSESKTAKSKDSKQVKSRTVAVELSHDDSKPVAVETKSADQKHVISTKSKSTPSTAKATASTANDSSTKPPTSIKSHGTLKPTKETSSTPVATTIIKKESSTATPATPAGSEKLKALTGTVTADFLKTIKIAKRKPKAEPITTTEPGELEEGETISPSPSPTHASARQIPSPQSPPPPPPSSVAVIPLPPPPPPPPLSAPPAPGPSDKVRERSRSLSRSRREGRSRHEEEIKKDTRRPMRNDSDRKRPSERRDDEDGSGSNGSKKENGGRYRDHSIDDRRRHRRDSRQSSDDRHRHRSRSPSRSHGRSRSASRRSRSPRRRPSNISRTRSKSPNRPAAATTAVATATVALAPPPPAPPLASAPAPPKPVYKNATSPDAETDEQCKLYAFMFRKLATAYKHRGDPKLSNIEGLLDHIHALLNYVLSFYYQDLGTTEYHGFRHWESLIPFTAPLHKHLSIRKELELYAICSRMMGMVRYYTFVRRVPMASKKLDNLISDQLQDKAIADATVATETAKASKQAFADFEEAYKGFKEADRYLNYEQFRRNFPTTFNNTCLNSEYGPGIVIGGEAGTSIEPQYPFMPFAKLHHAAIVSKCLLAEYIEKHGLKYNPIQDTDEYM